jgi:hypothetical protein
MTRHLYESPEGQAIIAQIEELSKVAEARREACNDPFLRNIKPAGFDWMTDEERARYHELQLQIRPLSPAEARERVLAKRAARLAEAEQQNFPMVDTPDGKQYTFTADRDTIQPLLF